MSAADLLDAPKSWQTEIKEALDNPDVTQTELARRLGVDAQTIHRWKSGQNSPRESMLPRLRALLHRVPMAFDSAIPPTEQWLFDSGALLRRYKLASEIWVMKTGKGLMSQEDGEARAVLAEIVLANRRNVPDENENGLKTVNFLVASEETADNVKSILELLLDELMAGQTVGSHAKLGVALGGTLTARKAQAKAIAKLIQSPEAMRYTLDAAQTVVESIETHILKAWPDMEENDVRKWVRKTIRLYTFDNLFELWATGLGFDHSGVVFLSYPKAPAPTVSALREEVLFEIDVREASQAADGTIQSNPRPVWIRPRDQAIKGLSERIRLVVDVIKLRGSREFN